MTKHPNQNSNGYMPLVTVIIPSYNHAQYIENAINSVLNQDYPNIELIVIDDGSKDETHSVLSGLSPDPRMRVVLNTVNRGQSAVLNQALQMCRGEFVCLLPSDDWYLPNKISLQVDKFKNSGEDVGVVYGRGLRYYTDLDVTLPVDLPMYEGWVVERFIKELNFIYPVTPMFRRACFEAVKPDETYKAEGEAIYMKIALKYKFAYVDEYLAVMRDHSYNTGKKMDMLYEDNLRYWNEFFSMNDLPENIRNMKNIPLSRLHRMKGLESIMLQGNHAVGRAALLKAIGYRFSYILDYRVLVGILISFLPPFLVGKVVKQKNSGLYR